ncbi:hypothetical protein ASE74_12400 [Pedobacter sp. Leaf216]|uniref:XrtY-associated glycosyltransferase XYAG1 n=1 Tax=Pedobacter sp. Leaf216 TaxID=1735684 RepID=UPI0006F41567|nr:glycosyltransferase [Pedobacter sp. Leaf216]KQM63960.1 hypothetical protein ASE74_12400 [Pedobacter sp. Leaf216]
MKIIQITASYKPAFIYGGPIQSVGKLCETLSEVVQQKNFDYAQYDKCPALEVLTTNANGNEELVVSIGKPVLVEGVKVTYFKRWTKDHSHFSPGLLWGLRRALRQHIKLNASLVKSDSSIKINKDQTPNASLIIHIHAWWNLVSVLSCWLAKWYKIPVVLSPRGMLTSYTQTNRNSSFKKFLHQLLGKKLLQYCHIHATSEQEKKDILEIVSPKSITVIPNLVNIQKPVFGSQLAIANDNPPVFRLIFLSRIEEKKGLELLFEALSLLEINWQLTIAGSGKAAYLESLKLKAQNLNLHQRINWIGQVDNHNKYELMAKHDLLVLTSFNENFANVVIESLSVGTPVLISNQVGLSDYVIDRQLGWVSALEAIDIKATLLRSYEDHQTRHKIRQMATEMINKDFDDQVLAKRYLKLYDQVV